MVDFSEKSVVFLDIDGMFCTSRVQLGNTCKNSQLWDKFDPVAVDFMNWVAETYEPYFVLVSTWKEGLDKNDPVIHHWVTSAFRNAGFLGNFPFGEWKTDPADDQVMKGWKYNRAHEVKEFLEKNEPVDFVIFDDDDYRYKEVLGVKRLIHCDPHNGITHKNMLNARSMMGNWPRKR